MRFLALLVEKTAGVPHEGAAVIASFELNGHVGTAKDGYNCHGGFRYGSCNADGERILVCADSYNSIIAKPYFERLIPISCFSIAGKL